MMGQLKKDLTDGLVGLRNSINCCRQKVFSNPLRVLIKLTERRTT